MARSPSVRASRTKSANLGWLAAIGLALTVAAPSSAQPTTLRAVSEGTIWPTYTSAAALAPSLTLAGRDAVHAVVFAPDTAPLQSGAPVQSWNGRRDNVTMMVVGGATLVAGSLLDGEIGSTVMVGGAAIALIGLYRYLR